MSALIAYPLHRRGGARRTIALQIGKTIVTERGQCLAWPDSYLALKALIFRHNLILFVESLPWPRSAAMCSDTLLWNNKDSKVSGIVMRQGRRRRRIVLSSVWPGLCDDPSSINQLRQLYNMCGVGDHPTPAALGQALMRKWYPRHEHRLTRPPWRCWFDLHTNLIGGRSELLRPGRWKSAWEEDINAAYPSALSVVPAGNCHFLDRNCEPIYGASANRYPWWFGHYRWNGPTTKIALPVLGIRNALDGIIYPFHGSHEGWYTKEEIYAAALLNYRLEWIEGWGWTNATNVFAKWVETVDDMRQSSRDLLNAWIKLMAVAGIGRFGVEPYSYRVLLYPRQSGARRTTNIEQSRYICDCDSGEILWIVDKLDNRHNPELLPHIAVKVHADVRLKTWQRAWSYAETKQLIATNFDAVYYVGQPHESHSYEIGEWKRKYLEDVTFPARRWLITAQRQQTPGLRHCEF